MSEKNNGKRPGGINRRDLLKAFSVVPAVFIPVGTAVAAGEKAAVAGAAQAAAAYQRKVFDDHQWETIKVLSDIIIPADGRSGSATQAGVPAFIDDWLDFRGGKLKAEILGGLTWLDLECEPRFRPRLHRLQRRPAEKDSRPHRLAGKGRARRPQLRRFLHRPARSGGQRILLQRNGRERPALSGQRPCK